MAYSHSFNSEVYGDPYNCWASERPTTVCDALMSMDENEYNMMAKEVFGLPGKMLEIDTVLSQIVEVDTVTDLGTPLEFWIDSDGYWRIQVHQPLDLSPHQFDDEQPRSLERFNLDDDTGPEQPYLGEM